MSKLFVTPDAHGNFDLVAGLLVKAGVLTEDLDRVEGIRSLQLGDLLNAVSSSQHGDNQCLDHAEQFFDKILVGNHEHPYLGGPAFRGYWQDPVLMHRYRLLVSKGFVVPAWLEDDILITHAGLVREDAPDTAKEAYRAIMTTWKTSQTAPLFSQIGRARGGFHKEGGILWADLNEPKAKFKQIFGHTPSGPVISERKNGTFTAMIDCGAKHGNMITGIWVEDGKLGEMVSYERALA